MDLLFLLVYAGAIAVLVLFVVMMLDVKATENPWSVNQKRFFYIGISLFFVCSILLISNSSLLMSFRVRRTNIISSLSGPSEHPPVLLYSTLYILHHM